MRNDVLERAPGFAGRFVFLVSREIAPWLPRINASGLSESEMAAVCQEIAAIERKIAATPAATPSALLCKAKVANHYIRIGWIYEKERDMMISLIADLERLAGGVPGV